MKGSSVWRRFTARRYARRERFEPHCVHTSHPRNLGVRVSDHERVLARSGARLARDSMLSLSLDDAGIMTRCTIRPKRETDGSTATQTTKTRSVSQRAGYLPDEGVRVREEEHIHQPRPRHLVCVQFPSAQPPLQPTVVGFSSTLRQHRPVAFRSSTAGQSNRQSTVNGRSGFTESKTGSQSNRTGNCET